MVNMKPWNQGKTSSTWVQIIASELKSNHWAGFHATLRGWGTNHVTSTPPPHPPTTRTETVCLSSATRGWCPLRLHGDNDMSSLLITKEANSIMRSRTEGWTCFICFCRNSSNLSHWGTLFCWSHVVFTHLFPLERSKNDITTLAK